jgi:hypothetical protein
MPSTTISDTDLAAVARVAGREGWADLSAPPASHAPRTIDEELAVQRFAAAVPRERRRRPGTLHARLALVALSVTVLGACWWVSPARTAIGLIGAGVFSLIALRRARRRERSGAGVRRPRSLTTAMRRG